MLSSYGIAKGSRFHPLTTKKTTHSSAMAMELAGRKGRQPYFTWSKKATIFYDNGKSVAMTRHLKLFIN